MNIFLVPAPPENVKETLRQEVDFERAAKHLDNETLNGLSAALGGRLPFHCWAVTRGKNENNFKRMSFGDELLFAVTGSGCFGWRGQVQYKFNSASLGDELWPHKGNTGNQRKRGAKSWELIYVVTNLEKINLEKRQVLQAFGYKNRRDDLAGLRRVRDIKTRELMTHFDGMNGFLDSLG